MYLGDATVEYTSSPTVRYEMNTSSYFLKKNLIKLMSDRKCFAKTSKRIFLTFLVKKKILKSHIMLSPTTIMMLGSVVVRSASRQ